MIKSLENFVFAFRTWILLALAGFTAFMFWNALDLRIDPGIEKQWPAGHEYVDTFSQYRESLPGAKRIIVVLRSRDTTPGSMWNENFLATLNGVTQDLFFIPGVDRKTVTSLWTPNTRFFEITEEGISADDVIGGTTTPSNVGRPESLAKVQSNVIRGGFVGRLVSNDFTGAMVQAELLEFDPTTGAKLDFFDFNDRIETTIRQRYEGAGGPAFWYVRERLEDQRRKAAAECPKPSEGMVGDAIAKVGSAFGEDLYIPAECGAYVEGLKAQLPTMELNYGPVVGSYYPTFKAKLDEIGAKNLKPAEQYAAIEAELDAWQTAVADQEPAFTVHVIGLAKAFADIGNGAQEVYKFFALAFVLTIASVWWYCRSWSLTFLTVGCSLVSVIWQFGFLTLFGFGLDPLAILVPFLVFAIGVSHGIQQMNLLTDGLAQGMTPEKAARYAFAGLFIPGMMALVTDGAGFATLYLVPIPMIQELAITSSVGVGMKIMTNLIMLPLLASLMTFKGDYRAIVVAQRTRAKKLVGVLGVVAEKRVAIPLFIGSWFVFAIAVYFGLQRQIGDVHAGMPELKAEHRYNIDARTISSTFNQALDVFTVVVEAPPQACIKYPYMEYMNRLTWHLRNVPGVVAVVSVSELAKQLNAGWYEGNLKWRGLPHNQYSLVQATGPIPSTAGVLNAECTLLPIHAFLANGKAGTIADVVAAVKDWRDVKSIPPALNKGVDNKNGTWTLTPAELDGLTYSAQLREEGDPLERPLTVTAFRTEPLAKSDEIWTVPADRLAGLVLTPKAGTVPGRQQILALKAVKGSGASREIVAESELRVESRQPGARLPLEIMSAFAGKDVSAATAFEIAPPAGGEIAHRNTLFTASVPLQLGAPGVAAPLSADIKKALEGQDVSKATEVEIAGVEPSFYIRLAAGNSGIAAAVNEEIHEQEMPMTIIVYGVIILLVIFTFFDWRATLCCTVPLTFATFFGYWFMYAMGIGLKVSTLPVMVLAVGIGVDYAFYIYDRLQHFLAEGDDITTAYKKSMEKTGMAVVFTAITLAIGVSTWAFSDLKFQADMGMLLTFMFVINMLNAVTILPAMAVTLDTVIPRRGRPKLHGIAAAEPHDL